MSRPRFKSDGKLVIYSNLHLENVSALHISVLFQLLKLNVETSEVTQWKGSENQYPTEPIFISNPNGLKEDHGVFLFYFI